MKRAVSVLGTLLLVVMMIVPSSGYGQEFAPDATPETVLESTPIDVPDPQATEPSQLPEPAPTVLPPISDDMETPVVEPPATDVPVEEAAPTEVIPTPAETATHEPPRTVPENTATPEGPVDVVETPTEEVATPESSVTVTPVAPAPTPTAITSVTRSNTTLAAAAMQVAPATGNPGARILVTGTNFTPGERVNIRWGSATGTILGYKDAGSTGAVSGAILVPQTAAAGATRIYLQSPSATVFAGFTVIALPTPNVTVSPTSALPGTRITVTGANFKTGERVNIRWGSASGPILGYKIATVTGGVSGAVLVPATAAPGTVSVYLQSPSATVSTPLTVSAPPRAVARVSPTSALPGAKIIVSGSNFRSGERVNIRWGSATGPIIGYKLASTTGTVSGTVMVPTSAAAGSTRVYLQAASGTASVGFTVQARPKANISISHAYETYGDVETMQGTNFKPGEVVRISFPGNVVVANVTVRSDGTFSGRITVPNSAAIGYNTITARGQSSGYTAGIRYEVFEFLWAKVSVTSKALPGARVTFSGSGFRPGEAIHLGINGNDTGLYVVSTSTGTISGAFTIPATAAIGNHLIQFANTDFTYYAEAVVTVIPWQTPTFSITNPQRAGNIVYFSGSGFGPNERVVIFETYTWKIIGRATTDSTGAFIGYGTAPYLYNGNLEIVAEGQTTGRYAVRWVWMMSALPAQLPGQSYTHYSSEERQSRIS